MKEKGRGPLFYNPTTNDNDASGDRDIIKPKRPPYAKRQERLAAWVRGLGVSDSEIQPNHAWRHTFKRRARVAGIEKGVRDAICGHAPKAVGDEYEMPIVEEMADALKKFSRYKID